MTGLPRSRTYQRSGARRRQKYIARGWGRRHAYSVQNDVSPPCSGSIFTIAPITASSISKAFVATERACLRLGEPSFSRDAHGDPRPSPTCWATSTRGGRLMKVPISSLHNPFSKTRLNVNRFSRWGQAAEHGALPLPPRILDRRRSRRLDQPETSVCGTPLLVGVAEGAIERQIELYSSVDV